MNNPSRVRESALGHKTCNQAFQGEKEVHIVVDSDTQPCDDDGYDADVWRRDDGLNDDSA